MTDLAATGEQSLLLAGSGRDQLLDSLQDKQPLGYTELDLSCLSCRLDAEILQQLLAFLEALPAINVSLRLAHTDLGSGTDCEQRIFDLKAEREMRESEKAFHQKKKSDSSKQKDFSVSAQMRRSAEEGINKATARLTAIDDELADLEPTRLAAPWQFFFSGWEALVRNPVYHLDLSNCCLHATGLAMLTRVLLEHEHRADCSRISQLVLDGNDIGDIGMASIASLLRLSGVLELLALRNVGITDQGVSQVLSGLVLNKSLVMLDLRSNGLCSPTVSAAAVQGLRQFNNRTHILLE